MLLQVCWYQTNNSLSSKDKPPKSKSKIKQKRQKLKTAHCKKTFCIYIYIHTNEKKENVTHKNRNSRYTLYKLYKI